MIQSWLFILSSVLTAAYALHDKIQTTKLHFADKCCVIAFPDFNQSVLF